MGSARGRQNNELARQRFAQRWWPLVLSVGLLGLLGGALSCNQPPQVRFPGGHAVSCELAVTREDITRGLVGHPPLGRKEGLLFLFGHADFHPFWMKGMGYAIDIIWLNQEGQIVHFVEQAPPCERSPCPSYEPLRRARFVLEVRSGTIQETGIRLGDRLNGPWEELARLTYGGGGSSSVW